MQLGFQIFGDFPDIFLSLTFKLFSMWSKNIVCMTWIFLNFGDLFHGTEYTPFCKCSTWTSEHSTRCPMNYEVFHSGCWEQEIFPPDAHSSLISSFPFGWVFPQLWVFSLFSCSDSYVLSWMLKGKDPQSFLWSSFFLISPLCEVLWFCPPRLIVSFLHSVTSPYSSMSPIPCAT